MAVYFLVINKSDSSLITIVFNSNGGNTIENIKVSKGVKLTLPVPTKENSEFQGWYDGENMYNNDTIFEKDTVLIAKWQEKEKTFTITFDSKGGNSINKMSFPCDKEINNLPTPTRNGYTFRAWTDKNEQPILNGALLTCEDLTLYAAWD